MPGVGGRVTSKCGGGMSTALLPPDMGLPFRTSVFPCFPKGMTWSGDSIFLPRVKIMTVIFLKANSAFLSFPQCMLFFLHAITRVLITLEHLNEETINKAVSPWIRASKSSLLVLTDEFKRHKSSNCAGICGPCGGHRQLLIIVFIFSAPTMLQKLFQFKWMLWICFQEESVLGWSKISSSFWPL